MGSSDSVAPGVGFQAVVGVYVGATLTGLVALGMVAASVSSSALLSTMPGVFTSGLVVGALAAWSRPGIAVRFGARRRTVTTTLPAVGVGGGTAALFLFGDVSNGWHLVPVVVATIAIALSGWGVAAIAHDTYVESITDEPAARWAWQNAGPDVTALGIGTALLSLGTIVLLFTDGRSAVLFLAGIAFLALGIGPALPSSGSGRTHFSVGTVVGPRFEVDADVGPRHELRAYDAGLVVEPHMKPSYRRLVSWDRIVDVRLTETALVLERRWRPAIRCDRSVIDEPESVARLLRAYTERRKRAVA